MIRPTKRRSKKRRPIRQCRTTAPAALPLEEAPALTAEELLETLLERIARGGKLCREVEQQLKQHPCPELETIIKVHRVLVLGLSGEAQADPERFKLVSALMKPVLEWARLEERRKQRELAEQKYRDEVAARQAEKTAPAAPKVLTPQTLEQIEHELHLF